MYSEFKPWQKEVQRKKREKKEGVTERAERAKARRKSALEQQQLEAAKKMALLSESGPQVVDINFYSDSASTLGDVEAMELEHEDAPVVCANEGEQQEESMAIGVETNTNRSIQSFYIEKLSDVKRRQGC